MLQLPHVCPAADTNHDTAGARRLLEAYCAPICIYGTGVSCLSRCGVLKTARRGVSTGQRREMACAQHE